VTGRETATASEAQLRFCARCLYRFDHPLGLTIDAEGICSGCRIHEEKDRLDWGGRWGMLEALVRPYRSSGARNYDCVVPVSGAADSYFIVHLVKERLKLNPLLVTYNKYFNTELGIRNLANLRIRFDCDIVVQNVNPDAVRRVTRAALRQFGSIYWHCLAGQTVFPVQTAVRYRIPLIIWGAHQGLEQVGMFSHEHEVQMTRRYRKDHDLMGQEAASLLSTFDTLTEEDLWQYRYPDDRSLEEVGVTGIYLGNYVRWDPKAQHELMISKYDYRSARFARTFDCYDYVDCFNYMNLHDLLKLYKHGYSKVTDHASREIRHGRLTRAAALALVRRHEQQPPGHLELFCEWLGVKPHALQFLMDLHRNPRYWEQPSPGRWLFKGWSTLAGAGADTGDADTAGANAAGAADAGFQATSVMDSRASPSYIVIGKGYP
jgi:N-acetyl sugar amidotransferase